MVFPDHTHLFLFYKTLSARISRDQNVTLFLYKARICIIILPCFNGEACIGGVTSILYPWK